MNNSLLTTKTSILTEGNGFDVEVYALLFTGVSFILRYAAR